jgi:DNA polymerase II large subunit
MSSTVVSQIERTISHPSHDEPLWLIEQLAHNLRKVESDSVEQTAFESQLAEVAIQLNKLLSRASLLRWQRIPRFKPSCKRSIESLP